MVAVPRPCQEAWVRRVRRDTLVHLVYLLVIPQAWTLLEYHHTAIQVDSTLVQGVVIIRLRLQSPLAHDTKLQQPDLTLVHRIVIIPPQPQALPWLAHHTKVHHVEYHHTEIQVDSTLVQWVVIIRLRLQTPLAAVDTKARQPDLTLVRRICIIIPPQPQALLAHHTKVQHVEHQVVITLPHLQAILVHDTRTQLADQILGARLCNCYMSLCVKVWWMYSTWAIIQWTPVNMTTFEP